MVFKIICVGSIPAILVLSKLFFKKYFSSPLTFSKKSRIFKIFSFKFFKVPRRVISPFLLKFFTKTRKKKKLTTKKNRNRKVSKQKNIRLHFNKNFSFKNVLGYLNYDFPKNSSSHFFYKVNLSSIDFKRYNFCEYVVKLMHYNIIMSNFLVYQNNNPSFLHVSDVNILISNFNKVIFFSKANSDLRLTQRLFNNFISLKATRLNFENIGLLKNLSSWSFLLRHRFFLKKIYKNRLLGSYPVPKSYFFYNDIFFPSNTNIITFNKSIRRLRGSLSSRYKVSASTLIAREILLKKFIQSRERLKKNILKGLLFKKSFKKIDNYIIYSKPIRLRKINSNKNLLKFFITKKKSFF